MALGDKGATLDGLKASHDNLDGKITDLKSELKQSSLTTNNDFNQVLKELYYPGMDFSTVNRCRAYYGFSGLYGFRFYDSSNSVIAMVMGTSDEFVSKGILKKENYTALLGDITLIGQVGSYKDYSLKINNDIVDNINESTVLSVGRAKNDIMASAETKFFAMEMPVENEVVLTPTIISNKAVGLYDELIDSNVYSVLQFPIVADKVYKIRNINNGNNFETTYVAQILLNDKVVSKYKLNYKNTSFTLFIHGLSGIAQITCAPNIPPIVYECNKYNVQDRLDTLGIKNISTGNIFDANKASGGYYLSDGYHRLNNTSNYCIVPIDVSNGTEITLSGFPTTGSAYTAYLNSNDATDFAEIAWNIRENNGTHKINSDYDFIGVCWNNADSPSYLMVEYGTEPSEYKTYTEEQKSAEIFKIENRAKNLEQFNSIFLSRVKNQPSYFAICDDDTNTVWSVEKFYDICKNNNVIGCYAAEAKHLEDAPQIIENLKSHEGEGFGVYTHCYSQAIWDGKDRTDRENQIIIESDLVKGKRLLNSYGFLSSSTIWVAPGGIRSNDLAIMMSFAKRQGFKYLVNADSKQLLSLNYGTLNQRYNIPRFGFTATDENGTNLTYLKAKVDECVASGSSMIFMTHTGMWDSEDSSEPTGRFDELMQYCLSKNMVNVNMLELLENRYPFYAYHEMR